VASLGREELPGELLARGGESEGASDGADPLAAVLETSTTADALSAAASAARGVVSAQTEPSAHGTTFDEFSSALVI
jgi:hypothetical protein